MGWTFGATKKTKAEFVAQILAESGHPVVAQSVKGNVLWTVQTGPSGNTIGCYLLAKERKGGWGYKDMCEAMHPYYFSCPVSFFELAPVKCEEWREAVRVFHAAAKATAAKATRLKVGDKINVLDGLKLANGEPVGGVVIVTCAKPLVVTSPAGRTFSLPRKYIVGLAA